MRHSRILGQFASVASLPPNFLYSLPFPSDRTLARRLPLRLGQRRPSFSLSAPAYVRANFILAMMLKDNVDLDTARNFFDAVPLLCVGEDETVTRSEPYYDIYLGRFCGLVSSANDWCAPSIFDEAGNVRDGDTMATFLGRERAPDKVRLFPRALSLHIYLTRRRR